MKRIPVEVRPDWKKRVEALGFDQHTLDGRKYWDESVCYEFAREEVAALAGASEALHRLALEAVEHVIARRLFAEVGVPARFGPLIEASWRRGDAGLAGRFDFSYDGSGPPKMLEYNADTPTSLPEAAIIQLRWLSERFPGSGSFNTILGSLREAWSPHRGERVHFCAYTKNREDLANITFHAGVAASAGVDAGKRILAMRDIGWHAGKGVFMDVADVRMKTIFKLYPWEWLFREPFAEHLEADAATWIEPPWKAVLTSKGLLPILWELFPDHPNLLPAFRSPARLNGSFAQKPVLSREGANITLSRNGAVFKSSGGRYGGEGFVWQALHELPDYDGNRPVVGVWMVRDKACGLGIREDASPITGHAARFVPHRIA